MMLGQLMDLKWREHAPFATEADPVLLELVAMSSIMDAYPEILISLVNKDVPCVHSLEVWAEEKYIAQFVLKITKYLIVSMRK